MVFVFFFVLVKNCLNYFKYNVNFSTAKTSIYQKLTSFNLLGYLQIYTSMHATKYQTSEFRTKKQS